MKQKWNILVDGREFDDEEIFESIFKARGITDPDNFFNPVESDMIEFDNLKNIDKAYQILMKAIKDNWNISIHADVDCDGCTSGAIMYRYLNNYTDKITITINKGKKHGVNDDFDYSIIKDKTLLIIVDSINESYAGLFEYISHNNLNVQVIVLDHHIIPKNFDDRITLVSSANEYENPELSGAGVCLKFCQYVDFNELECYSDDLFDLAACGLVADMVDMRVMENRYIVKCGLNNLKNPGISAVIGNYKFDSTAISFSIAPLVNAACRTFNNETALDLFIEDDIDKVYQILEKLRECKQYQDRIVEELVPKIIMQNESQKNDKVSIFIIEPRDDISIAGLIANRLCDNLQKPVMVLNDGDIYSGSARGIGIESFIDYVRKHDVEFANGHENAFGIGIAKDKLEIIKFELENELKDIEFINERTVDVWLDTSQISRRLIDKLKYYNTITGEKFKPITVCIKGVKNAESKPMKNGKHMRMIKDGINFIKWNSKDDLTGKKFDMFGTLDYAFWGKRWQYNLICDDYMEV